MVGEIPAAIKPMAALDFDSFVTARFSKTAFSFSIRALNYDSPVYDLALD
jgi:hypothetical protein